MIADYSTFKDNIQIDFTASRKTLIDSICDLRSDVLQPPPWKDPEEWFYENIDLPKSKTERAGKLVLTGYQREFIRLYFDPETNEIDATKGTRVGMSLLLSCLAAYILDYLGEHVTIAQPTESDAQEFYKERIEPLFEMCPSLGAKRRKPKKGESQDTWNLIEFTNGAVLRLIGAASDDNFRRFGSKHNWCDEGSAENWKGKTKSQGLKFDLFRERGGEYAQPKFVIISSPTTKGDCLTTEQYEDSDKQEPHNRCPHCKEMQVLEWGDKDSDFGFKLVRDENGFVDKVYYECRHCHTPIYEHEHFPKPVNVNGRECFTHKDYINATTEYRPSTTWKIRGRRGMYVPQWLSPNGRATWKVLGQEWLDKHKDPERRKTWVNNVAGVAYDDFTTSSMDPNTLDHMRRPYPAEVPDDVVVLVMGVDNQTNKEGNHLEEIASRECTVVGYNRYSQKRVIGHWIVEGAPGDPSSDAEMRTMIYRKFKKRDGTEMPISATAIDLGGHYSDEVRAFASTFPKRQNVWAIKGRNNAKGTRSAMIWPKRVSKTKKTGTLFYMIDSQLARDAVFRLMLMSGDAGMWIPDSMPTDYIDKLMCEERVKVNSGWYWKPKKGHRAEEEWMCLAYAYVALKGLQFNYRAWRDLNLASDRLGIAKDPHDEETGELMSDYSGADFSAHVQERQQSTPHSEKEILIASKRGSQKQVVAQPARRTVVKQIGQGAQPLKRKGRSGGIISY